MTLARHLLRTLTLLSLLTAAAARAAVPNFTESIACDALRIRLPKGVEATPTPPMEAFRFVTQLPDGSTKDFDAYTPEQLWRRAQRLGTWQDKDGNRYELVAPKSRLGGPYPRQVVTQEEYDKIQSRLGPLKPSGLGMWIGEWLGATCGKPQPLRTAGAVRMAQFAVAGNHAILVFILAANPRQPYALIVSPGADAPAQWRTALQRALPGFAPASSGLSGTAQAAGGWITIDKPPYRLHTDLPKRDHKWLNTLLFNMCVIRRVYTHTFPEPKNTQVPTSVIRVFADPAEYHRFAGEDMENSGGFFSSIQRELVIKGDAEADSDDRRDAILSTTFHEGFHQYLYLITPPLIHIPTWFNEGHATYFETFQVKGGTARPGPSKRLQTARQAITIRSSTGLAKLMAMSQEEFYGPNAIQNYAVAWALVSYLRTRATPEQRTLLNRYYALLLERKTQLEANAAVFPPEVLNKLAEDLDRYLSD